MNKMLMILLSAFAAVCPTAAEPGELLVYGDVIYTMRDGELNAIQDGVVWINDGEIRAVGRADEVDLPRRAIETLRAAVVTPGLIDPRSTAGLTGIYNSPREDQDMLERSSPVQPELRALDAYNPLDQLVTFLRDKGVTTLHTGHAPGETVSGQLFIVKTSGNDIGDGVIRDVSAVSATLSPIAVKGGSKSPGTRAKLVAVLRAELIKAQEYARKVDAAEEDSDKPARNLRLETLSRVLAGELPLLVTANRAQDIDSALRLRNEFGFELWLDSGAESYLVMDELRDADVPVFLHPTMARPWGDMENMSWTTSSVLADAGVRVLMQSGYEGYVPKVRVVLFEAAIAAVNGLGFERALASITHDAAAVLGISDRVGSIEPGKDGDLALYSGDPFEYTTTCIGTVIEGVVVSAGESSGQP